MKYEVFISRVENDKKTSWGNLTLNTDDRAEAITRALELKAGLEMVSPRGVTFKVEMIEWPEQEGKFVYLGENT